jgi:probable F420-dependent oxidoreductase
MRIGAVFPTKEIGADADEVAAWARGVEELGLTHALVYDHVLGADTRNRPDWQGPYDIDDPFHEPLVLLGFLAAATAELGLVTGVVILPQRQTALVAKQAAQADVLSKGRLRLGVGLGWNQVEYEALGESFSERGRRIEEQLELLRMLWSQRSVDFEGRWDRVPEAGLSPLPVQHPIPVWRGGGFAPRALERIGRLADGWMPLHPPNERGRDALAVIHRAAEQAGRDPRAIGVEGRIDLRTGTESRWEEITERWRSFGATHACLYTMDDGLRGAEAHLERLRAYADSGALD